MTAEALMELGFNKRMATILSLLDEVPDNVQSRQNVELLKQCVDLNTLKEPLSGILIFLTREYETNLFMMSVPEKYGFTPQERKKYLSNPFNWEYECDLKEDLDEQLQQIFTDEEKRMSIYRKLYLKGRGRRAALFGRVAKPCSKLQITQKKWKNSYQKRRRSSLERGRFGIFAHFKLILSRKRFGKFLRRMRCILWTLMIRCLILRSFSFRKIESGCLNSWRKNIRRM